MEAEPLASILVCLDLGHCACRPSLLEQAPSVGSTMLYRLHDGGLQLVCGGEHLTHHQSHLDP